MDISRLTKETIEYVKQTLKEAEAGHDWWHISRVFKNTLKIAENYTVNKTIMHMGALLHDIADSKFNNGDEQIGPKLAKQYLSQKKLADEEVDKIIDIIKFISFKSKNQKQPDFIEFKIIQDADRLDAIGAIGIARTFHYGGYKNRELYNPDIPPVNNMDDEKYKNNAGPTINHFQEKLLKIKSLLNTPEAKEMAVERHNFMLQFLEHFHNEWNVDLNENY